MDELRTVNRTIKACAFVGFCVASYALYAELSLENDPDFKPFCDLREYVQCSPAFASPFAKGFGIVGYLLGEDTVFNVPNGLVGTVFYALSFALSCSDNAKTVGVHYYLTVASNMPTIYLALVLALVVKKLCLVCVATYLINAMSLLCVASKRRRTRRKPKDD